MIKYLLVRKIFVSADNFNYRIMGVLDYKPLEIPQTYIIIKVTIAGQDTPGP